MTEPDLLAYVHQAARSYMEQRGDGAPVARADPRADPCETAGRPDARGVPPSPPPPSGRGS